MKRIQIVWLAIAAMMLINCGEKKKSDNIIAPKESADMMQSLVMMYEDGGWLPIFPCWNSYTAAMIGDHCSVALADAYVK